MEGYEKIVNYRVKMQTDEQIPFFAGLPIYDILPVDINIAHKYCQEYNEISQKADPSSIQGKTKYWVEEIL